MKTVRQKICIAASLLLLAGSSFVVSDKNELYAQSFFRNLFGGDQTENRNEKKPDAAKMQVSFDRNANGQETARNGSVLQHREPALAEQPNGQYTRQSNDTFVPGSIANPQPDNFAYASSQNGNTQNSAAQYNTTSAAPVSAELPAIRRVVPKTASVRIDYTSSDRVIPATPNRPLTSTPGKNISEDSASTSANETFAMPNGEESLDEIWEIAVAASRKLQAADYATNAARKQVDSARGIAMPKLANNTSAVTLDEQPCLVSSVNSPLGTFHANTEILNQDFVYSVTTLTVPLYLGGKVQGMIESAQAATKALQEGRVTSEQDVKAEVTKLYFLVLRVRSLLKVAEEAEQTTAAHENDANRMSQNGLLTRNVLLAAQVAHANAQQNVLKARNSLQLAEAAFNRLLWRPLQTPVNIKEVEIPPIDSDLKALQDKAIRQRSELAMLSSQATALSSMTKVHKGTRMPNVALVGSHVYLENDSMNTNTNFVGAISMVWMPFDGGTSRAQEQSAQFQALAVCRMQEDAKTAIELQVYQNWLKETETRERLAVAAKAAEQADENLRVVRRSFQEGLLNHTEVLDAQTQRTLAWNNFAHAKYDAIQAVYDLRRSLGEL